MVISGRNLSKKYQMLDVYRSRASWFHSTEHDRTFNSQRDKNISPMISKTTRIVLHCKGYSSCHPEQILGNKYNKGCRASTPLSMTKSILLCMTAHS